MRIRTQFLITILIFGLVAVAISASAILTNRMVGLASEAERTAANIAQSANELSYMVNDYLVYRESLQLERCQARFAAFSSDIAHLRADQPEQQELIQAIQTNAQRMKEVFDSIVSTTGVSSQEQNGYVDPAALQVSWSRMTVQSQTLISDASQLAQSSGSRIDALQKTNFLVVIALVCVFGAYFMVNYFLVQRRTLKSLAVLRAGTSVVGSGKFDFKLQENNDEIGDVARAFNRMTANLKEVTASKADLETANKELEAFSYSVSHDLRQPLRTLDGFSELVIMDYGDKLDETGKDYLNRVRKASQTMSQLIDDILNLSRITRAEMHQDKVNLSHLTRSIADQLQATQPERQAEFNIAPEIIVQGDNNLLQIGLMNLLDNAWKFTAKTPHTRIELGLFKQNGETVYFVKDNGIGFDMQYNNKLFQPFQRLHSYKEYPGTGIGLAIVQRVILRHNGRIWAESEIGQGSTFYFTLGSGNTADKLP